MDGARNQKYAPLFNGDCFYFFNHLNHSNIFKLFQSIKLVFFRLASIFVTSILTFQMNTFHAMSSVEPSKRGIFNWTRRVTTPPPVRSTSPQQNENKKLKRIPGDSKSKTELAERSLLNRIQGSIDSPKKTETPIPISNKTATKDIGDLGSPWQRANVSVKSYYLYLKRKRN